MELVVGYLIEISELILHSSREDKKFPVIDVHLLEILTLHFI